MFDTYFYASQRRAVKTRAIYSNQESNKSQFKCLSSVSSNSLQETVHSFSSVVVVANDTCIIQAH